MVLLTLEEPEICKAVFVYFSIFSLLPLFYFPQLSNFEPNGKKSNNDDDVCAQSCSTLCYPMNCSPWGSSVQGISQARILEWVAISYSRGSSRLRDLILRELRSHILCGAAKKKKTLNLSSVPSSLYHLGESKGNRLSKEAFDDTAERERTTAEMAYTCNFARKIFLWTMRIQQNVAGLNYYILKGYILKSGPKWTI